MSSAAITAAVDRGWEIVRQIEQLESELEGIEATIRAAALTGHQIPLEDPEREGRQYLAVGHQVTVPVVLTADLIQASFADGSPVHKRLASIAGDDLPRIYQPTVTWKMVAKGGKEFRRQVAELLGPRAPSFVDAALLRDKHGVPKSAVKVEWKRAHAHNQEAAQ